MPTPETIRLRSPDGAIQDVDVRTAATVLQDPRWRVATAEDETGRVAEQAREVNYGGVGGAVKAGVAGVARGATFGASDVALRALGGDDAAIELEGLRETNPGVSIGTEIVGALAPALVTGGATLPAGAAARLGGGVARAAEGSLGRIGGAAAGGAVEGALFGAGQGVSELALSQDPLTVERIGSALSSHMLFGGAIGVGAGALGKAAELGLGRAKSAIDGALDRRAARTGTPAAEIENAKLDLLDVPQLKVARDAELGALRTAQQPEREAFVAELRASREATKAEKTWIATEQGATREIRELGRGTLKADQRIEGLLAVERDLVDKPQKALSALRQEEQALTRLRDWGEGAVEQRLAEVAGARDVIRAELLANKIPGYVFGKGAMSSSANDVIDDITERIFKQRYPDPARLPTNLQVLNNLPAALERNKALQDRLAGLMEGPVSERLGRIEALLELRGAPKAPSLSEAVLGAAVPFAGPLGAAAAAGGRALGSFKKVLAAATERAGKAVSSFLGAAERGAKVATPAATRTLAAVRYAVSDKRKDEQQPTGLPALYKARTDEVKSQAMIAADGSFQMRPSARAEMAKQFDGIRAADPILADQLETAGARRIAYLASIIPRRPDAMSLAFGPDLWQPSDMEMRGWARAVAAAEDPYGVLDRATHGAVTPEDAATMQAVHPEILADFVRQVSERLPELRKSLPYARRIALSILTGMPVDPAMDPAILRVLQAQYQYEPPAGGPRAEAQFGSVKMRDDMATPSQRREEGSAA